MLVNNNIVPVLMFHSLGLNNLDWVWSHISEPRGNFEQKLQFIAESYRTLFLGEMIDELQGAPKEGKPALCLTFDDGYLDNWSYLFPLLKKYALKATIFVNPEFVDPTENERPTYLNDVGNPQEVAGFLNWTEMQTMEMSGLVDIQSHALTHTWYFTSPMIVDVLTDLSVRKYPWTLWNHYPKSKPFYLNTLPDYKDLIGTPILENQKSLIATKFQPDPEGISYVQSLVKDAASYSQKEGYDINKINLAVRNQFGEDGLPGEYETAAERRARILGELRDSKTKIEEMLSKSVDYVCWPGGGNDAEVRELASEVGYKAWTLGSTEEKHFRNIHGSDPSKIKRVGSNHKIMRNGVVICEEDARFLKMRLNAHKGSLFARVWCKFFVETKALRGSS